jgi:argininosuccinate lyase
MSILSCPVTRIYNGRSRSHLLATDMADYLVKKGAPFREAHEIIGRVVAQATQAKLPLNEMPLEELRELSPLFDVDLARVFDVRHSLPAAPRDWRTVTEEHGRAN